jgi:membrane protease YdiL (CAAX protease family)
MQNNNTTHQKCPSCGADLYTGSQQYCQYCGQHIALRAPVPQPSLDAHLQEIRYNERQSAFVFFKAILFVVGLQIVLGGVLASLQPDDQLNLDMTTNLLIMLLSQGMFFLAVITSGSKRFGSIRQRLNFAPRLIWLSLALWAVAFVAFLSTNVYFAMLLHHIGYNSMSLDFVTPVEIILAIIVIGIAAPICEELVFRFGMLEGYKGKGIVRATLLTSLAFALMHMNPEQTFYQFMLGVVCALAAIKSNSIVPAIIIHGVNNIFALVLSFVPQIGQSLDYIFAFEQVWFVPIAILMFILGLWTVYKLSALCSTYAKHTEPSAQHTLDSATQSMVQHYQHSRYKSTSGTVYYVTTIVFCSLMWGLTFASSMGLLEV